MFSLKYLIPMEKRWNRWTAINKTGMMSFYFQLLIYRQDCISIRWMDRASNTAVNLVWADRKTIYRHSASRHFSLTPFTSQHPGLEGQIKRAVNSWLLILKVGMVRFELTTSTSRTWRANRAALHPGKGCRCVCASEVWVWNSGVQIYKKVAAFDTI